MFGARHSKGPYGNHDSDVVSGPTPAPKDWTKALQKGLTNPEPKPPDPVNAPQSTETKTPVAPILRPYETPT